MTLIKNINISPSVDGSKLYPWLLVLLTDIGDTPFLSTRRTYDTSLLSQRSAILGIEKGNYLDRFHAGMIPKSLIELIVLMLIGNQS